MEEGIRRIRKLLYIAGIIQRKEAFKSSFIGDFYNKKVHKEDLERYYLAKKIKK